MSLSISCLISFNSSSTLARCWSAPLPPFASLAWLLFLMLEVIAFSVLPLSFLPTVFSPTSRVVLPLLDCLSISALLLLLAFSPLDLTSGVSSTPIALASFSLFSFLSVVGELLAPRLRFCGDICTLCLQSAHGSMCCTF